MDTTPTPSSTPGTTPPGALTLRSDETVTTAGGRQVRATELALGCLPRVRAHLVGLARAGGTTTYGALVRDLDLPFPAVGVGRLLDLLAVDCARRDEPGLDAIVGPARGADDVAAARVHRHWTT